LNIGEGSNASHPHIRGAQGDFLSSHKTVRNDAK
jgi:hypothetical protein